MNNPNLLGQLAAATPVGSGDLLGHWSTNKSMKHDELDIKLLQCLGLSEASANIVMQHILELRAEIKSVRRKTLLDASTEVAGHWNDRSTMCNQYQQAQRSAEVLQRQALEVA